MKKDLRGRPSLYDVYVLINPETGNVFYVGCTGNLPQRIAQHQELSLPSTAAIISSLKDKHMVPIVAIVFHQKNRDFALREEANLIAQCGHFIENVKGNQGRKKRSAYSSFPLEAF